MGYIRTNNFFRPVHPALTAVILITFLYLLPAISFWPEFLPTTEALNTFVQNYQYLVRNVFILFLILHLFEAIFAMMICTYMDFEYGLTLKWGLSVLINGVFALRYIWQSKSSSQYIKFFFLPLGPIDALICHSRVTGGLCWVKTININIHLVSGAWVRTHDFSIMSRLP